jgi:ankyrin repeat protein
MNIISGLFNKLNQPSKKEIETFCQAARAGQVSVVTHLLDRYGKDIVNAKTAFGESALLNATSVNSECLVSLLVGGGADVNARSVTGFTALMVIAMHSGEAAENIMERLIGAGADLNAKTTVLSGGTALMQAETWGNIKGMTTLLEAGADIYTKDCEGNDVIDQAKSRKNNNADTLRVLYKELEKQQTKITQNMQSITAAYKQGGGRIARTGIEL